MKRCERCWTGEAVSGETHCTSCKELLASIINTVIVKGLYLIGDSGLVKANSPEEAQERHALTHPGADTSRVRRIDWNLFGQGRVPTIEAMRLQYGATRAA